MDGRLYDEKGREAYQSPATRRRAAARGTETYRPGQAGEHVFPHVPRPPEWFIDCGPADAEEYIDAQEAWPEVRLLGLEPSPSSIAATRLYWPEDHPLLQVALWDRDEEITLHKSGDLRHGTAFALADHAVEDRLTHDSGDMTRVQARSLDSLDAEYGPFRHTFLWMDVEGSERRVLRGAEGCFSRGAILGVNIETRPDCDAEFTAFFTRHGLKLVRRYLANPSYWDAVWIREDWGRG